MLASSSRPGDAQLDACVHVSLQLKEMCRRELDKSELEIKKNGSIIGEYKQVRWSERSLPWPLGGSTSFVSRFSYADKRTEIIISVFVSLVLLGGSKFYSFSRPVT